MPKGDNAQSYILLTVDTILDAIEGGEAVEEYLLT